MARKQRDARLQTRSARADLPMTHEPYWHEYRRGLSIGYRKGTRGGTWWLREYRGGKLHKRRVGLADDTVRADGVSVLSWEDVLQVAGAGDRPTVSVPSRYTVEQALEAYFDARRAQSTPHSVRVDESKAKAHIGAALRQRDVNSLKATELQRWRDSLVSASEDREAVRRAQATANRIRTIFFAALEMAHKHGLAASNDAWRKVEAFEKVDRPRTRFLEQRDAVKLLRKLPLKFRELAQGALYSGLRLGELLSLKAADMEKGGRAYVGKDEKGRDHFRDSWHLVVRHSKSGKGRNVPLSEEGATFFRKVTKGKPSDALVFTNEKGATWHRVEVSRLMRAGSEAAGLKPPATFHDLRRSYASLLINAGAEPAVIQELLGHADLRMTRRTYAHLLQQTVAAQVQRLPSFSARKPKEGKE